MLQKFLKSTSNSEQAVITIGTERQKKSFPKEQVENADLYVTLVSIDSET